MVLSNKLVDVGMAVIESRLGEVLIESLYNEEYAVVEVVDEESGQARAVRGGLHCTEELSDQGLGGGFVGNHRLESEASDFVPGIELDVPGLLGEQSGRVSLDMLLEMLC